MLMSHKRVNKLRQRQRGQRRRWVQGATGAEVAGTEVA